MSSCCHKSQSVYTKDHLRVFKLEEAVIRAYNFLSKREPYHKEQTLRKPGKSHPLWLTEIIIIVVIIITFSLRNKIADANNGKTTDGPL